MNTLSHLFSQLEALSPQLQGTFRRIMEERNTWGLATNPSIASVPDEESNRFALQEIIDGLRLLPPDFVSNLGFFVHFSAKDGWSENGGTVHARFVHWYSGYHYPDVTYETQKGPEYGTHLLPAAALSISDVVRSTGRPFPLKLDRLKLFGAILFPPKKEEKNECPVIEATAHPQSKSCVPPSEPTSFLGPGLKRWVAQKMEAYPRSICVEVEAAIDFDVEREERLRMVKVAAKHFECMVPCPQDIERTISEKFRIDFLGRLFGDSLIVGDDGQTRTVLSQDQCLDLPKEIASWLGGVGMEISRPTSKDLQRVRKKVLAFSALYGVPNPDVSEYIKEKLDRLDKQPMQNLPSDKPLPLSMRRILSALTAHKDDLSTLNAFIQMAAFREHLHTPLPDTSHPYEHHLRDELLAALDWRWERLMDLFGTSTESPLSEGLEYLCETFVVLSKKFRRCVEKNGLVVGSRYIEDTALLLADTISNTAVEPYYRDWNQFLVFAKRGCRV